MRKGYAIIMVLAAMTYIMMLAIPIIGISCGSAAMSRSSNNLEAAYYVAEAGIERSISIIKKDFISGLGNLQLKNTDDYDDIKYNLDNYAVNYFYGFTASNLKLYNQYRGDDGASPTNGRDTMAFSRLSGASSYYSISNPYMGITDLALQYDGTYRYKIPFLISSVGCVEDASQEIKAQLNMDLKFKLVPLQTDNKMDFQLIKSDINVSEWQS